MSLTPGQSLSFYEILGPLGAGGMGEVYRAKDTRLDREVAIKVLPEELAGDEERLQRFAREAKTLASLNHANVGSIYGFDQQDGLSFLALEFVPGEDLAARLTRGSLPVTEAIEVCRQIAEGLEAAHEAGVVHRDLKPANVRITPEGTVKILDFGLAKPIRTNAENGNTTTTHSDSFLLTSEGVVLGTPTYMSPEQARGKPVDRRTDIWAFGCVLYECLTGRRAFEGEAFGDLMAAILEHNVDLGQLPTAVPDPVRELIVRTLTKDPRQRLRDIGEARLLLEGGGEHSTGSATRGSARPNLSPIALVVSSIALLVAGFLLARAWSPGTSGTENRTASLSFRPITDQDGLEISPCLSPDGNILIYAAQSGDEWDIFSQRVGGSRAQNLTEGIDGNHHQPALSRDGNHIAFRSERDGGGIFVMGATGESPRRVTNFGFNPAWSPDGAQLAFATEPTDDPTSRSALSQLFVVNATGGTARKIDAPDAMQPAWSPNGRWLAFWGYRKGGQRDLWVVAADGSAAAHQLTDDVPTEWSPVWAPDGKELWFSSNRAGVMNLWRLAFDPATGRAVGNPRPETTGVGAKLGYLCFSREGSRMALSARVDDYYLARVAFDPEQRKIIGEPKRIPGTRNARDPRVSADGKWLAVYLDGGQEDIFVMAVDGSQRRQITDDVHKDRGPVWAHDDSRIYFYSDRSGSYRIWSCVPDGSDLTEHCTEAESLLNPDPAPDGRRLLATSLGSNLWLFVELDGPAANQTVTPLAAGPILSGAADGRWSPDGRWLSIPFAAAEEPAYIGLLPSDGTTIEKLQGEFDSDLIWLPDSSAFVGTTLRGDHQVIDLETRQARTILSAGDQRVRIEDLSRDGRWIYFTVLSSTADIWLVDRDVGLRAAGR